MKALLLLALAVLPARAFADEAPREAQLLIGGLIPLSKFQDSSDKVASPGMAVGGRLLGHVAPEVSLGGEVIYLAPTQKDLTPVPPFAGNSNFKSLVFLLEAKLAPASGSVRPFGLVGLGGHSTSVKLNLAPSSGFVWSDTGTTEDRAAIDSTKTGFATTVQGGVDFLVSDRAALGFSLAWYYLAKTTYEPVPSLAALGVEGVKGAISSLALLGSFTYRF